MNYLSKAMFNLIVPKFRFRVKAGLTTISVESPIIRITEPYPLNNCYRTVTSTKSFPLIPVTNVGIATAYGLDGPGFEYRWGRDFLHLFRPA